ncbi:MAG: thioredoxin 1 [Chitinophagales bacterium]|jgi:thioredoxin 1
MAKGNLKALINQEKALLIDFYATWCGPRKAVQPILKDVAKQAGDKVRIIKIDMDKNPMAGQQYKVQSIPTLMLFKGGELKWRQSGVAPANIILQKIEKYA